MSVSLLVLLALFACVFGATVDLSGSTFSGASVTITGNNANTTLVAHKTVLQATAGDVSVTGFLDALVDNTYATGNNSLWEATGNILADVITFRGDSHRVESTGTTETIQLLANGSASVLTNSNIVYNSATTGSITIQGIHVSNTNIVSSNFGTLNLRSAWVTAGTIQLSAANSRATFLENVVFNGRGDNTGVSSFLLDGATAGPFANNLNPTQAVATTGNTVLGGTYNFNDASVTSSNAGFYTTGGGSTNVLAPSTLTINFAGFSTAQVQLSTVNTLPLSSFNGAAQFLAGYSSWGPLSIGSGNGNQLAVPAGSCLRTTATASGSPQEYYSSDNNNNIFNTAGITRDMYFLPVASHFHSNAGAQFCDASSVLTVKSSNLVLGGVSFSPKVSFVLVQTFRNAFGEPLKSAGNPWIVTPFSFRFGNSAPGDGVTVTLVSTSTVGNTITRSYQIDVTATCDGAVSIAHYGSYEDADNFNFGLENHGFDGRVSSIVYAKCLANQFCF